MPEVGPDNDQGRYRVLIDAIPYGFYSVGLDGRVMEANEALCRLLGYPASELVGLPFQQLLPADEQAAAARLFEERIGGRSGTLEFDIWVVRRDGERRLLHVASCPIREGGGVVGSYGIARDITQERVAEERVRRSEERLRLLLDRVPAIVWAVDRDLRFTFGSGRGLERLGLSDNALVGTSLQEYFGTSDPSYEPIAAHQRALEGHPVTYQNEWQGRAFEARVEPIRDGDEVVGAIGAALDVTESMETERQLLEQRAHWQRLFDASPEAIALIDREDRVLQTNPEFERLFGYTAEEAIGRPINELIAPPERRGEAHGLSRQVLSGERISVETVRRRKDGTLLHVSILGTPVNVGDELFGYGIYRDITEEQKLREQLLHSQRLEAVGRLAGGIAHDFNNILTAILGHARLLASEVTDASVRADLETIASSAERAAALTRQLLTFSRRQPVERRDVDVSAVIGAMAGMLGRLMGSGIDLDVSLEPELPAVSMDPGQLEQVVMNLVINARDSMPEGGRLRLRTRLLRRATPPSRPGADPRPAVVVEVADTGTGMTTEERSRMFEPFFTTKEPGKGTGLGLSMVYGIVDQSGGWIDVETEPGAGTVICVHFPVAAGGAEPAPEPRPESRPGAATGGWILLVDDDPSVLRITQQILDREGYTVQTSTSGEDALEMARSAERPPDLLLTDLVMPGMSGHALAAEFRTLFPDAAVLFMSGYTGTDVADGPVDSASFIPKPFDPPTLARRVREALD